MHTTHWDLVFKKVVCLDKRDCFLNRYNIPIWIAFVGHTLYLSGSGLGDTSHEEGVLWTYYKLWGCVFVSVHHNELKKTGLFMLVDFPLIIAWAQLCKDYSTNKRKPFEPTSNSMSCGVKLLNNCCIFSLYIELCLCHGIPPWKSVGRISKWKWPLIVLRQHNVTTKSISSLCWTRCNIWQYHMKIKL